MTRALWLVAAGLALAGCSASRPNAVTVYVSEDQVFSEPILRGDSAAGWQGGLSMKRITREQV